METLLAMHLVNPYSPEFIRGSLYTHWLKIPINQGPHMSSDLHNFFYYPYSTTFPFGFEGLKLVSCVSHVIALDRSYILALTDLKCKLVNEQVLSLKSLKLLHKVPARARTYSLLNLAWVLVWQLPMSTVTDDLWDFRRGKRGYIDRQLLMLAWHSTLCGLNHFTISPEHYLHSASAKPNIILVKYDPTTTIVRRLPSRGPSELKQPRM